MGESTSKEKWRRARVKGTAGLARHLGISRWTVSRVLNGHDGIRDETRKRVLEAVEDLGFEPNRLARGLRGLSTGLVGVSFQHFEAMVLTQKSQVLQEELGKLGYRGIFEMPRGDPQVEEAVIRHFLSIQVDGIVLIGSKLGADAPVLEEVRARGVAIVAVDSKNALRIARVSLDRGKAMELKLGHLVGLGHRRIAIMGLNSDDLYRTDRIRGLRRAAQLLGLDGAKSFVWMDDTGYSLQDYAYGAALARRVMDLGREGPTALLCLNDRLAIGALRTLQEAGRNVPGDYSVIGFDNIPESAWSYPALTTIDQNIGKLMRLAHETLWLSKPGGKFIRRKVEPRLQVRGSTGPARKD